MPYTSTYKKKQEIGTFPTYVSTYIPKTKEPIIPKITKSPGGSTLETLPSGLRKVTLPERLGGGSYITDPKDPKELILTERAYGGVKTQAEMERDHKISVAIGGTSDRENIKMMDLKVKAYKDNVERYYISQYKAGKVSLGEARVKIVNWDNIDIPGQKAFNKTLNPSILEAIKEIPRAIKLVGKVLSEHVISTRRPKAILKIPSIPVGKEKEEEKPISKTFLEFPETALTTPQVVGKEAEDTIRFLAKIPMVVLGGKKPIPTTKEEWVQRWGEIKEEEKRPLAEKFGAYSPEKRKELAESIWPFIGGMRFTSLDKMTEQLARNILKVKLGATTQEIQTAFKTALHKPEIVKILRGLSKTSGATEMGLLTKSRDVLLKVVPKEVLAKPLAIGAPKAPKPIPKELKPLAVVEAPVIKPKIIAPKELSGFKNFISKESPIGSLRAEINIINGRRLSGKITSEEANKSIQELKKEISVLADRMGIAERIKGNKAFPAIRQSGFFATKEIQTAPIRDIYNQALSPYHMALKQDGYKLGGPFGEVFKKVWKPTERAIRSDKELAIKNVKIIKELGGKHKIKADRKNLEHLSDVVEGKIVATPQEGAYIKELRSVLDDLRNQANVVRKAMGKTEIGYIEDYIPHLQKTSLWNELLSNRATISDNLDFIIPNQVKNPFAFKRMMEEMPKVERNLYVLLDRYIRAIGKDINITPAIENIKAYNSILKNREIMNASRYWDEYIRTGLIGKQHKLDIALSIGLKTRKALQKWNNMVNLAFLTGKLAWNVATQPLSYIMNVPMETGVKNSLTAIFKSFGKGLRQYVRENSNTLAIKANDVRAVAIGEGRNIQNRIYRTKIDKYNEFISMLGAVEERTLTLTSYVAGLDRAKALGYKGEDALWFADLTAARTQSMYNKENRALILDSDVARTLFPFQSFSIEMFNHLKEIIPKVGGAMQLTIRQRFGKLFGLMVGIYFSSLYSKALTGRRKTTIGTFFPFVGNYIDMLVAKAMGEEYYGGRSPITVVQIGQDIIKGCKNFIEHGDLRELRKAVINFGLALGGIGGGGQINNLIDGIMANIDEDVKNVKGDVMFKVEDTLSKIIAPFFGVWATMEGREYFEPKEEEFVPIRGKSRLEGEIREGKSRI